MKDFLNLLSRLKHIPRAGWLQGGVELAHVENIYEHSYDTTVVAMIISDHLSKRGFKIDKERLLKACIIHDWAECLVMDEPRPARKYFDDFEAVKRAERRAVADMLNKLPEQKKEYQALWEVHLKNGIESRILNASDRYVLYLQAKRYKKSGYESEYIDQIEKYAKDELRKARKEIPALKKILEL